MWKIIGRLLHCCLAPRDFFGAVWILNVLRCSCLEHETFDAVFEYRYIEIDEQAHTAFGESHIRQYLCIVFWNELRHDLEFKNDPPLNPEVELQLIADRFSLVYEWAMKLLFVS